MANNYKKTITLGLDYSEFSGGISECNRKMGLLDAEMKLAQEQAKEYGDETDQLKIRQEALAQKIILQKKVVEEQAKAYDIAMSSQKKSEKQVDALDKTLLQSRTTLQKLENEYKDNTKRLDEFAKKSKESDEAQRSFGDTIRDVASMIGIEASPAVETLAGKFDAIDENVGKAILTVGTLVTTLGGLTIKTAEHAKEIQTVSQTMGMTTNEYQAWDYVLKSVGYDAESASGDLAALAEKAKDAAEGGNDSAKTFRILGVSIKDTNRNLKSQGQLFTDVIKSLRNMEDVTTRNAIASDLLSTTGEKIVPILNMTNEELKNLMNSAYETGYVMSGETLNGFNQLNESMNRFKSVSEALSGRFAEVLLPALTALFNAVSVIPTPVLQLIITLAGVVTTAVTVMKAVDSTVGAFNNFMGVLGITDAKTIKTTAIILGVVAALIALAAVIAVIIGKGDDLNRTMDTVSSSVGKIGASTQNISRQKYNARGTDYFEGGETWVGEAGPELVRLPRGSRIMSNSQSKAVAGDTYIINVNADIEKISSVQKLVEMAKNERLALRVGKVKV
ncbi:hypothetical protein QMP26_02400 [Enterocloster clostridioformis]|uniref:hypothetical protein n=1 Tax=Enterocloster clostridioformis TaxID=1531 RepID=UPI0026751FE7|nr:hypothetical protein [Enterocloster clostridioformis]